MFGFNRLWYKTGVKEESVYAVVFVTEVRCEYMDEYYEYAAKMRKLVEQEPGFIRLDSVRDAGGRGITVSYWKSREAIQAWKENAEHKIVQKIGKEKLYKSISLKIMKCCDS